MKDMKRKIKLVIILLLSIVITNLFSQTIHEKINLYSGSNKLNADFYQAPGNRKYPTLILMHGFPGGEGDPRGFSSKLSAKGINILVFNYQGTWSSKGTFSIETSMDDVTSAITFLKQNRNIDKFNIDTSNITIGGWSYGGAIALTSAIYNTEIQRIISIAGADESVFGRQIKSDSEFYKMFYQMFEDVNYPKGPIKCNVDLLFKNWIANLDNYDLVKHSYELRDRDILLLGGWKDKQIVLEDHILPLYRKLQELNAANVKIKVFDTNHEFGNVKEELVNTIEIWIKEMK